MLSSVCCRIEKKQNTYCSAGYFDFLSICFYYLFNFTMLPSLFWQFRTAINLNKKIIDTSGCNNIVKKCNNTLGLTLKRKDWTLLFQHNFNMEMEIYCFNFKKLYKFTRMWKYWEILFAAKSIAILKIKSFPFTTTS